MSENAVHHLQEFKWRLVVEFDHREMQHKGRSVKGVNDLLNLLSVEIWGFAEGFWFSLATEVAAI